MDYFIYLKFLKRFISFRKIKKFLYKFLIILFIVNTIILLLSLKNVVFGVTVFGYELVEASDSVLNALYSSDEYNTNLYDWFIIYNGRYRVYFVEKSYNLKIYFSEGQTSRPEIKFNKNFNGILYDYSSSKLIDPISISLTTQSFISLSYNSSRGGYVFSSSLNAYSNSSLTNIIYNSPYIRIEPSILNTSTDLTGLLSNYITVDSGNLNITDLTFAIFQQPIGVTRSTKVYSTVLNSSSPFYHTGGVNGAYYDIPISVFKDSLVPRLFC